MSLLAIATSLLSFAVISGATARVAHAQNAGFQEFPLTSGYDRPLKLVTGPDGNIWFTELTGPNLGMITPSGSITEYAKPPGTLDGVDTADITNGPGGNLWYTDPGTNSVGEITTSGSITEFPIPSSDTYPWGITAGPDGNLWITQQNTAQVAKVSATGVVTEYAIGGVNAGFITSGPDGNLWFADTTVDKIGQITPSGTLAEFSVTSGAQPNGIVAGSDGNIWFTEQGLGNIGVMSTSGTLLHEYPILTANSAPSDIVIGSDGHPWFSEFGSNVIGTITTGGVITEYPTGTSSSPYGITTGPDGNIWYAGYRGPSIGRFALNPCASLADSASRSPVGAGQIEAVSVTLTSCGVAPLQNVTTTTTTVAPSGCSAAPAIPPFTTSSLATGQTDSHTTAFAAPSCPGTYTVNSQTTVSTTVMATASSTYRVLAIGDAIGFPTPGSGPVAVGSDGNLWYTAAYNCCTLIQVTPAGVVNTFQPETGVHYGMLTSGADGNLYMVVGSGSIAKVDPGSASILWQVPAGGHVNDLAPGPDGNIWFTTGALNGTVGFVTPADKVKIFHVAPGESIWGGITSGSDGAMWFGLNGNELGRITTSGAITRYSLGGLNGGSAMGMTLGPDGNVWLLGDDPNSGQVLVISVSPSGAVRQFPTLTPNPSTSGITTAADGNVWFNEYEVAGIGPCSEVGRVTPAGAMTDLSTDCIDYHNNYNIVAGPDGNVWNGDTYCGRVCVAAVMVETGASTACSPITGSTNPSSVAQGSTETVAMTIRNCAPTTHLVKLTSKTIPPAGGGTATTEKTSVPLQALVQTTVTSSFTAPSCTGTYKVTSTLTLGTQTIGKSTVTYQVT